VALTKLQADIFVTSDGDLARAVSGLVDTATTEALGTARMARRVVSSPIKPVGDKGNSVVGRRIPTWASVRN
jgi:hypothetical protein